MESLVRSLESVRSIPLRFTKDVGVKYIIIGIAIELDTLRDHLFYSCPDMDLALSEEDAVWMVESDDNYTVMVSSLEDICNVIDGDGLRLLRKYYAGKRTAEEYLKSVQDSIKQGDSDTDDNGDDVDNYDVYSDNSDNDEAAKVPNHTRLINGTYKVSIENLKSSQIRFRDLMRVHYDIIRQYKPIPKKFFVQVITKVTMKVVKGSLPCHKLMACPLNTKVVGAWTKGVGYKERYNVYTNGDFPSDTVEMKNSIGNYLVVDVRVDIDERKFNRRHLDMYLTEKECELIKYRHASVELKDHSAEYVKMGDDLYNEKVVFSMVTQAMNTDCKYIVKKKDSIYHAFIGIIIDPVLLIDMLDVNNGFPRPTGRPQNPHNNESVKHLYDKFSRRELDPQITINEETVPLSFKKFVKFRVKYAGLSFYMKINNKYLKEGKSNTCTVLELTGIEFASDLDIVKSFCAYFKFMYEERKHEHHREYYGSKLFTDPFKKIKDPDLEMFNRQFIGARRYCKSNHVSDPIIYDEDKFTVDEFIEFYEEQGYIIHHMEHNMLVAAEPDVAPVIVKNKKARGNLKNPYTVKGTKSGKHNSHPTNKILSNTGAVLQHGQLGNTRGLFAEFFGYSVVLRSGIERSKSSFLRCIFTALNKEYDPEYFRVNATGLNFWLAKQEAINSSVEDLERDFRDLNVAVDSRIYIRVLEEYFGCNIIVFSLYPKGVVKLEFKMYDTSKHIWYPMEDKPYIAIVRNYAIVEGSKFDPPYELLAVRCESGNLTYIHHNSELTVLKYTAVLNKTIKPIDTEPYSYQVINPNGRCIMIGKRERGLVYWRTHVDRPLNLEVREVLDHELPTLEDTIERYSITDVAIDIIQDTYIIGVWSSPLKEVYYPVRRTPYYMEDHIEYIPGDQYMYRHIDRKYSNMYTSYCKFRNDCIYTRWLSMLCTIYMKKVRNPSFENFCKRCIVIVNEVEEHSEEFESVSLKKAKEMYPYLFEDTKMYVSESYIEKLRSLYIITSKYPNSTTFESITEGEGMRNCMSFSRYEDLRAWYIYIGLRTAFIAEIDIN
ncbi:hypothetical protein HDU85_005908 [Gaertneriomyces sp. JEL0708]|nr:hypothetical protein HDU85_005908 [Gaertneriomyces sp. JEL0708]